MKTIYCGIGIFILGWIFLWWRTRPEPITTNEPPSLGELKHALTSKVSDKKVLQLFALYRYPDIETVRAMHDLTIQHRPHLFGALQAIDPMDPIH